ncbi:origin recognition complex subunit 1 [Brevipalpus obovatus]|uniref:origin recognition complex subunit 1 n=1 Tax=Brevipalpus obovatus TaxID=246614 RepID=UPI003D9E892D
MMQSLTLVRKSLGSVVLPGRLPCREREFDELKDHIMDLLVAEVSGCINVTGMPGTGKTATVNGVRSQLEEDKTLKRKGKTKFQFVYVNGLKLTDPYQCYSHIYYELEGKRIAPAKAEAELTAQFSSPRRDDPYIILIIDEIDSLYTSKQDILYHIYDWPNKPSSRVLVIGIANTHDHPERMDKRVRSRAGSDRIIFNPYDHKQLKEIALSRIGNHAQLFEDKSIEWIARKVASISGDARRLLDILRRAVDNAQADLGEKTKKGGPIVTMKHAQLAEEQSQSSVRMSFVREGSEFEKAFLKAMVTRFRISGVEEATCSEIYDEMMDDIQSDGEELCFSEFLTIAHTLHDSRLILIEPNKIDTQRRVRLGVTVEEVRYALQLPSL